MSAKRLFPNFSFIDAPFNLAYYKPGHPETEIAYMGCRTRVMANMNDPSREIVNGRGNLSFTSINLPRLGILSDHNVDAFLHLEDMDGKMGVSPLPRPASVASSTLRMTMRPSGEVSVPKLMELKGICAPARECMVLRLCTSASIA